MSVQGYGLYADPDADADINDEVFDWNGEFQVRAVVVVTFFPEVWNLFLV